MKKSDSAVLFCHRVLGILLQSVTVFYVLAMGVILPYYYDWKTDYSYIGSNKAYFFQRYGFFAGKIFLALLLPYAVCSLLLWLKKNGAGGNKCALLINSALDALSVTDKFAIVYLAALGLSYYYTEYRETLRLGVSGWYMGFLPQMVFIGSYFAISRFLPKKAGEWLPAVLSAVSMPVFLLGVLNRYGYLPPGMTSSGPGYISTIGNINWFCGYWAVIFPLTAAWFVFRKRSGALLGVGCCIGFACGLTQGSDSGILALAGMLFLLFCLAVSGEGEEGKKGFRHFCELLLLLGGTLCLLALIQLIAPARNNMQTPVYTMLVKGAFPWLAGIVCAGVWLGCRFYVPKRQDCSVLRKIRLGLVIAVCAALALFAGAITVNTLRPGALGALSGNPVFTFDREWGSSRGGTWAAGIRTWLSQDVLHKVVGVGPDGMWLYIDSGKDPALLEAVRAQFGDSRLTNAHGEWITLLADLGLFGLLGHIGMVLSAIWRFGKKKRAVICGVSLFAYTLNNIFSFQQTMIMTQVFLVLGLGEYLLRQETERRGEEHDGGGERDQDPDSGG